jgi:hypothetical protein
MPDLKLRCAAATAPASAVRVLRQRLGA